MATETSIIKRARKQASRPHLFAPLSDLEMAQEHASIDCLDVLQKASEASDEKAAKRLARYADRAFKTLALYHPFYHRLSRTKP
jgi:hypothetical protein